MMIDDIFQGSVAYTTALKSAGVLDGAETIVIQQGLAKVILCLLKNVYMMDFK
jgi:argininosuccinate lyase